jgi:thiol-disulfide isomerase/thioredoxin
MRYLLSLLLALSPAAAQSLTGRWDCTVTVNDVEIPFRMDLAARGTAAEGSFFNGEEKLTSTSGRFENGTLALKFDYYAGSLDATLKDGGLEGIYKRPTSSYAFRARPHTAAADASGSPNIAGVWDVPTSSSKGEAAWTLIVRQKGAEVSGAIQRIDGDTGVLTGSWRAGKFVLSHFSGARPSVFELTPKPDGTLRIVQNGKRELTAVRYDEAKAKGLPQPDDPAKHTSVKDANEPLRFSGPDLDGRLHSEADFRGKVVIVAIGGSWCPNCHDEAPFLEELYEKYRARGLEVVALSFEEADQLKNPTRLRAFIQRYGIQYTVLLEGEQKDLEARMPQGINLDSWPTSFFLGRDGRVRAVHAGFAGKATGELHQEMRGEITSLVERLLAEGSSTSAAAR